MGEIILSYLWTLDRQFLKNLQKRKTGTVFTNFSSSLTIPGGEEELLLPLRQLVLKHIISTYPPKVAICHHQLSNEVSSPGKSHRRTPPESNAPITAWAGHSYKEIKVAGDGDTMHENEPRDADTRSCLVKVTLIPST